MKPIIDENKLPKFLVVNATAEKTDYNKHLPKPWKNGELVKVAPFKDQVRNKEYDDKFEHVTPMSDKKFRSKYVRVIRKDEEGRWTLNYTAGWDIFNLLTNKAKTK